MASSISTMFKQVRRTPYQALIAVLILALSFFAVAVFVLISAGSHLILKYFEAAPQVIVFFERGKDLPDQDIDRIKQKLEATGKLGSFTYVSTKEAEKIYKEKNENDPLLNELVDYKILPPSIEISATDIDSLGQLKDVLESEPQVTDIAYHEDVVSQMSRWFKNVRYTGLGMIGFLLFLSILILIVIIGLKVKDKRKEIEIMRLLGASAWYVHSPFLLEGMFYGALGAFFGWLGMFTALQYATPVLIDWLKDIIALPINITLLLIMLGVMVLGGMVVGAISSLLAVRRFLRV
ncbi:FtsX-like permease family protein [Candidatus Beckwithbacteria bacterium]|nr:FtsX-like permease family protein [Candidatus Beckwithbacteria bacterium]